MARIRVCGECFKPVRECICDEDAELAMDIDGLDGDDEDAA